MQTGPRLDKTYRIAFVDLGISLTSLSTDHGTRFYLVLAPHLCLLLALGLGEFSVEECQLTT